MFSDLALKSEDGDEARGAITKLASRRNKVVKVACPIRCFKKDELGMCRSCWCRNISLFFDRDHIHVAWLVCEDLLEKVIALDSSSI